MRVKKASDLSKYTCVYGVSARYESLKQKENYSKRACRVGWTNSTEKEDKFDSSTIKGIIYLNSSENETLNIQHGHASVLYINSKNEGVIYSFYPPEKGQKGAEMRKRYLNQKDMQEFIKSNAGAGKENRKDVKLYVKDKKGDPSLMYDKKNKRTEDYEGFVYIPVTQEKGLKAYKIAENYYNNPTKKGNFSLTHNCENVAFEQMHAAVPEFKDLMSPNWTFENAKSYAEEKNYQYGELKDLELDESYYYDGPNLDKLLKDTPKVA